MTKTTIITKRNKELEHHEAIIFDGLKSFQYVGASLRAIRDGELYAGEDETFESYCKRRFGFAKSRAYQLIESAEFMESFSTIVEKQKRILPSNEGQTRALMNCADDNQQRAKVWDKVLEVAGEKPITAKLIDKVADEIRPQTVETKPEPKRDKRTEFDPEKLEAESQSTDDIKAIIEDTKEGSAIVRLIQDACRRAKKFFEVENGSGSWMKLNSVIEHLDKAELEVKMSLFECECPRCKKKHSIKCELCGGRKFLDKRHANMLTDADKAALEAA